MDVTYRPGSEKTRDTTEEGARMRGNKGEPVVQIRWLNFYVWKNMGFHGFEMNNCQSEHRFSKYIQSLLLNLCLGVKLLVSTCLVSIKKKKLPRSLQELLIFNNLWI